MSKLTRRQYKNIAKRPSARGYGRAVLRSAPEVEVEDLVAEAEAELTELAEGEAELESEAEDAALEADAETGKTYEQPQSLGSIDKGVALDG